MVIGVWLFLVAAPACTGGTGKSGAYDGGGGGGSGGSATGGGGGLAVGGTGGQSQSPGMASFKVTVAPGSAYCDEESWCDTNRHFAIREQAGTWIDIGPPPCAPTCSVSCVQPPCPGAACIRSGMAYVGGQYAWSGAYYDRSTCGAGLQCFTERFLPAGRYVARACATPGTVVTPDGGAGNPKCAKTGEVECVEVAFDLPSTGPVELVLGPSSTRDR